MLISCSVAMCEDDDDRRKECGSSISISKPEMPKLSLLSANGEV